MSRYCYSNNTEPITPSSPMSQMRTSAQELPSFRKAIELSPHYSSKTCLITITHSLHVKWDLFVMVLAIYNGFSIPFSVAFTLTPAYSLLHTIDSLIDFIFFIDIILNFRTTYINIKTGEEVSNGVLIARNYVLSGRFLLDLLSTLPFSTIGGLIGDNSSTLELFSLVKLIRVFRLGKIIFLMRTLEPMKLTIRSIRFIVLLLMYLSAVACAWRVLVFREQLWQPAASLIEDYYSLGV